MENLASTCHTILLKIDGLCTDADGVVLLNPKRLDAFKEETDCLKRRMGLEPFQAILFAVILQIQAEGKCTINKVAKHLGMSYIELLSYSKDLFALQDNWFITIKDHNEIKVPFEVVSALMKNEDYHKPKVSGLSTKVIMRRIDRYMHNALDGEMAPDCFLEETESLIEANPETSFGRTCLKYLMSNNIPPKERLLFYIIASLAYEREITVFDMFDVADYISEEEWATELKDLSEDEKLALQKKGILVPAKRDGLIAKGSLSIKEDIEKELFADVPQPSFTVKISGLKDLSDKPVKQLFYNPLEQQQVERLSSLLTKGSLNAVYETMKEKGLRTGFICLFYGDPGTGKTETVYQIAKQTGRKILEADVAQLRNCYVGETEKNMRDLFLKYRMTKGEEELCPILLFNEADAILGRRLEGAVQSVDRMENSVQNILLEEMENFEGIMIATTNLLGNLDPAFERRFLFKIRFNKPELEPRSQIWKSQFPSLTEEEATLLAKEFSFSGGQIENVVRKYTIDSVLSGSDGGYEQLVLFCREESVIKAASNKIGF